MGEAAITTGGDLKARYVIHTVGPRMGEGDEDVKLKNATWNALKLADENKLKSIAFPAISTGIFGFPMERCAEVMIGTIIEYLSDETGLQRVVICLFDKKGYKTFVDALEARCGR